MKRLLVLLLLLVAQVLSKGEVLNKKIVVAPITPRCKGRLPTACVKPTAFAKVDADHVPSDYQCPCEVVNAGDGTNGGIEGATGIPVQNNDDQDFFVDEVLASGFDSPVAVAFADNDRNMFVGERGGKVWNVDLSTGSKVVALDFNKRVGFSGDRGLMDIKVHPNYKEIAHLMVMFTCDHDEEDGKEPDAESAQNQKIVRVDIDKVTGIHPAGPNNLEAEIIGGVNRPGGYKSGVPLCYNTHALGEMFFGHDATLMVTTGEGAHWNFDMGDWGQDADGRVADGGGRIDSLDAQCAQVFGPDQDVGSWRSQILNSLAGKILRITPDTGEGICAGSQAGNTYMPRNPFCNGLTDNGSSDKSKVWATGLRNPFRMTMRPFNPLKDSEPGVFYFGDVGQGGYEEVNAVTKPGMNFGWPCWEGPLPSPMMRDSIYNDDPNHTFDRGCGGSAAVVAPCKPITTIAYDEDGIRLTCPHMYKNKTTTLPFLYWTRYRANDNAGYFTENAYTGQGFYGATTAGLAFYSGKKYPTKYQGKLFALDFTEKWIKVIDHEDDQYISTMHFAELIHTLPTAGAKVTLSSGPDGNICYLTMNGGEVRCFRYVSTNVAPVPIASAVETAVNADNAQIQFSADGTADREGDEIAFLWNFGDGSTSSKANPLHTYVTKGTYTATLTATDSNGNKAMVSIPIITNNARPKVSITSPIPNLPGNLYQLGTGSVTFDMNVVDETPAAGLTYYWEYKFVHNSHQHDKIGEQFTKSFTVATLPDESAVERNSLKIVATATDASGVAGSAWIMIARPDWMTAFGNKAPVAQFVLNIPTGIARVGQPVTFDARQTLDPNGDYLTLTWSWGDGLFGTGLLTSHTYDVANPAGYTVKLNVSDNWGWSDSYTLTVPVTAAQAISPSSSIPSGPVYDDVNIVLSSIEPGSVIYYELFQGNPNGTDVTPASTIYTGPIKLSYTAGVTANLLIKARSSSGGVPSDTVRYTYDMVPPPCTTMGLGAAGNNTAPGSAFCINPLSPGVPSAVVNIPPKDPWNGQVFTDAPPPSEPNGTKVIVFMMNGLNGTPAPAGTLIPKYATTFPNIWVNSGSAVGAIAKMMIEYDWTGDGTYDRREVFINYAPDPDPTTWESSEIMFQRESNKFIPTSPTGTAYRAFANGNIKISIWEAISENAGGNDPLQIRTGNNTYDAATQLNQMSTIQFPYSSLYVAQSRAPGTPLPTPPPAYSGTDGWPTQPPVNTAVNTDQSRSSAVTSNAVGTSAGTSGTAGTTAGTAGTSATGTGTNTAATSMIGASSASSNSTSGASAGSQAASRGAEGTTSNSNIIVCSFFLIVLALL